MLGLMFLALIATVLVVPVWVGLLAYRATRRRWVQVVVTLLVLWLPFWDVLPGLYYFNKAIREVGGLRISRTVQAAGYLDATCVLCREVYTDLRNLEYDYVEVYIADRSLTADSPMPEPGYYQLSMYPGGSAQCRHQELAPHTVRFVPPSQFGLGGVCVISARSETPVSGYRLEQSRGWQHSPQYSWLRNVDLAWERVVDNHTNEVIAEAYSVRYAPWFPLLRLDPWAWVYTDHLPPGSSKFELSRIIKPTSRN